MEALKILLLEDSETDAEIVKRLLRKESADLDFRLCMTKEAYVEALNEFTPDVILADNALPQFNATEALNIVNHLSLNVPFILVTGTVSEEFAVDIIKRGADDYVLKDRLARLPAAIDTAIKNRKAEKEKSIALYELVKSEEKYRTLVEQASDGIFIADSSGKFIIVNNSACKLSGYSNDELKELTIYDLVHPESLAADPFHFEEMMQPLGARSERKVVCKDGSVIDVELSARFLSGNNRFIAFVRDIRERKRAEEKIIKANRLYAFISQVNQMIVRTTDENILYRDICNIAVEYGKFKMAWIGLIDETSREIVPVIHAGEDSEYLATVHSSYINEGAIGKAISYGQYYVCNDFENDTDMGLWKEAAMQRGFCACISLPLKKLGNIIGMLKVYSAEKNFFDETEIELLQEVTNDVCFALEVIEKERLRKESEALVIANEKKFRKLVENGNDAFAILNPDGQPRYVSSSVERVLGYTEAEIYGMDMFSIVHPDNVAEVLKTMQVVMENPGVPVVSHLSRLLHKDGTYHWFEDTITNLLDDPDVGGIVDNFRDVTGRVNDQQALVESEEKHRNIVENISDILCTHDLDGNVLSVNSNASTNLGYDVATMMTMNVQDILAPYSKERFGAYIDILKKHGFAKGLMYVITSTGENRVWEFKNSLRTIGVETPFVYGFAQDVTERIKAEEVLRESERTFSRIFYLNPSICAINDLNDDTYVDVNEAFLEYFGFTKEEVIGKTSAQLGILETNHRNEVMGKMDDNGIVKNEEVAVRTKNGEHRDVLLSTSNIYIHDKEYAYTVANDITERKKADAAIKASEEKYRMLVAQAFDGIIIYSPEGKILDCNLNACKNTGYSEDELKRMKVQDLFFEKELSERPLYFKTLKEGHSTLDYRRLKRKDGTYAEMEIGTKMTPDGNLMAIGRDITERKKAQEKLEENEKRFRALVERNDGIISLQDNDNQVIFRSTSAARITGWTNEEFEKIPAAEYIHPDDVEYMNEIGKIVMSHPGHPVPVSLRVMHKKGHYIWLEGVITNLLNDAAVKGVVSNLRDITKRKKAEEILNEEREKFTKIAATSPGLIYSFRKTPEGKFSFPYTSSAVEELFGFKYEEIANDVNKILSLSYPEDAKHVVDSINRSASTMQPWKEEFRYIHPQKGEVWLEGNSIPMAEPDGSVIWHGIIADITERKNSAQKIIQSELNLKAIFDNTSEGFILVDINGTIKTFNSNANANEIVFSDEHTSLATGKSVFDFVEPSRQDFFKKIFARVMRGESVNYDRSFADANGKITWFSYSVTPVRKDSYVNGLCITSRDITERKKAEEEIRNSFAEKQQLAERMSTILRTLPANIALLDEKGIIVDVNEAWKNFADENGFAGSNHCIGLDYIKISHNAFAEEEMDGKVVARGIRNVLSKKLEEFVYEYPCHSPHEKRWFRMVAKPISGKENNGAVVMHVNITQLRLMEQERMESKNAEQKNITQAMILGQEKERNAIGRELHDNMNQILAGINLLLGMLRTKPERLPDYLPLCIENINLAIAENRKIAHELVSPNQLSETLVNQIERLCKNMLQNAGLTTSIDHEHFDETIVKADQKLAVYRVVQEQCTNIVKYAQAGSVDFLLSTAMGTLTLKIKDNGQGMKAGKSTDGIGLQNMMSRVSVLNGTLSIDTKPGQGFALHVTIPLN